MAQVSLYYRTQLEEKVSIAPSQINAHLKENILNNLKANVEGKSNVNGIVLKVIGLIDHNLGQIDRVHLTTNVDYTVTYECYLCSPVQDLEIICEIDNIFKGFIIGKNGPVIVAIQLNNIDSKRFMIQKSDTIHIESGKKLEPGDLIKASVINISNNAGEDKIVTMCKLINLATKEERESYAKDKATIIEDAPDTDGEYI